MKRSVVIRALAAALALALLGGVAWLAGAFRPKPFRIATMVPLSGPDADVGRGMRNAVKLAVDEANARGGIHGRQLLLVEVDDASSTTVAAEAARKLAADEWIVGVVGHYNKDVAVFASTHLREAKLPNIWAGVATRDKGDLMAGPTDFSIAPLGAFQMGLVARHAWQTLGARNYMFVHDASDFAISCTSEIRNQLLPMANQQIPSELIVPPTDEAMTAVLDRAIAEAPQYVFFAGRARQAGLFAKALRARGSKATLQVETHHPSQAFIDTAGAEAAEGALTVFAGLPPDITAEGRTFLAAYTARAFADPPGPYGIFAYAGAQALIGAIEKSFANRPSIAGALSHEKFDTALGKLGFHYMGSTHQAMAIYRVEGGRWVPQPAPAAAAARR